MSSTSSNESFDSRKMKYSPQRTDDTSGKKASRSKISEGKKCTGRCTTCVNLPAKYSNLTNTPEHATDNINERKIVSNNEEDKLQKQYDSCVTSKRRKAPLWQKLRNIIKSKFGRKKKNTGGTQRERDMKNKRELRKGTECRSVSEKCVVENTSPIISERDSEVVGGKERQYYQNGQSRKWENPANESSETQIENKVKSQEVEIERGFGEDSDADLFRGRKSQQIRKSERISQNDWDSEVDEYQYRKSKIVKLGVGEDSAEEIYLRRNTKPRWDTWEDSDRELENYSSRATKCNRNIGGNIETEYERDSRRSTIPQKIVGEINSVETVRSNFSLNREVESDIEIDSRRSNISKRYDVGDNYTKINSQSSPHQRLRWSDSDLESHVKQTRIWEPVSSKYRDFETENDDAYKRRTKLETFSSDESNSEIEKEQPLTSCRKSIQAPNMQERHDLESRKSQIYSRRYNESDGSCISGSTTVKKLRSNTLERREKRPLTSSDESTEPLINESESDSRDASDPQFNTRSQGISKKYHRSVIGNVSGTRVDRKSACETLEGRESQTRCLRDYIKEEMKSVSRDSIDSNIRINVSPRETMYSQVPVYSIAPESSKAFSSSSKSKRSCSQSTKSGQKPLFHAKRTSAARSNSKIMRKRRDDGRGINTIPENDGENGINESITLPESNVSTEDDLQTKNVSNNEYRANDFPGSDTDLRQSSKIQEYLVRGPSENDKRDEIHENDSSNSNAVLKQSSKRKEYSTKGASRFQNSFNIKKQPFADSSGSERCVYNDGCKEGNTKKCSAPRRKAGKNAKRKRRRLPSNEQYSDNPPACANLSPSQLPYPFSHYPSGNSSSCRHTPCFHTSRFPSSCTPPHSFAPARCSWVPNTWGGPSSRSLSPGPRSGPGWRPNAEGLSRAMRPADFTNHLQQALGPTAAPGEQRASPARRQTSPSSSRRRLLQRSSDSSVERSTTDHSGIRRASPVEKHVKITAFQY